MECSVAECDKPSAAKGFCKYHYQTYWRTGSPIVSRRLPSCSVEDRFWRYVGTREVDACWGWTGGRDKDGYGLFRIGRKQGRAHRASWAFHNGEIPAGKSILHSCHNPSCVNPSHLRLGDHSENMRDRHAVGRYAEGERHPMAKVPDVVIPMIRSAADTAKEIGARVGLSASQVRNIRRGDQRRSV